MQGLLVGIHDWWRWVVLVMAVAAIVLASMSVAGSRPWDTVSDRVAFFFTLALDIQVLIGLAVWFIEQRWGGDWFLGYVHPLLMIGAVGLAHVGRARAERVPASRDKGRQALLFFFVSLVVVLLAIPIGAWPL